MFAYSILFSILANFIIYLLNFWDKFSLNNQYFFKVFNEWSMCLPHTEMGGLKQKQREAGSDRLTEIAVGM